MIKNRKELIKKYIDFFKSKGHKEIPNSSLVPQNDPTVLFTTAGMHPLVPYLLGQPHPLGKRLVNVQKCIRTGDIDEVGDEVHHTFFEMLGNWSLGDYFKKEAIKYSFEFLTKELNIPIEKLAVSVFAGDKDAPKDEESAKIWKSLGIKDERIAFLPKENNWWGPAGNTGPCGPDTEMFFYVGNKAPTKFNPDDKKWMEIWNDVLMQYVKDDKGNYNSAKQKNVDTGMGVERALAVLNGFDDNYLTSAWQPIIKEIEKISKIQYGKEKENTRAMRIIADHIKASVLILSDGVIPSNTERGYVLRRLIRRAVRYGKFLNIENNFTTKIAVKAIEIYEEDYSHIKKNRNIILTEIDKEERKFNDTLEKGLKQVEKIFASKIPIQKEKFNELMKNPNKANIIGRALTLKREGKIHSIIEPKINEKEIDNATITGEETFLLFQSYGFPLEMIDELAMAKGLLLAHQDFRNELTKHQELSRTASAGTFKSGLADNTESTTKLHTATHLLNQALREILKDNNIKQKGSNINPERLRFDFNFPRKLEEKEIKDIENWVNDKIKRKLQVKKEELALNDALKSGAQAEFGAKYPDVVSVYTILDDKNKIVSREICTGPHISNTAELGKFKIIKEESSAAGIRRIKATLE